MTKEKQKRHHTVKSHLIYTKVFKSTGNKTLSLILTFFQGARNMNSITLNFNGLAKKFYCYVPSVCTTE